MVFQFAPRSNGSDPCEALNEFNAQRPERSSAIQGLNIATFVILSVIHCVLVVIIWKWRNKSQFRKVRPFSLNSTLLVGLTLYNAAPFLSYATDFPCVLLVIFYFAISWLSGIVNVRLQAICFEVAYAKLTKKEKNVVGDDQASQTLSISHASTHASQLQSVVSRACLLNGLAFGYISPEALTVSELVVAKKNYFAIFGLYCTPAWVTCILLIALVPPFQTCTDCLEFAELPIGFTSCLVFYVILLAKACLGAYRAVGFDDKGVVKELLFVPLVLGPTAGAVWLLMLFDPGNLAFDRKFNWSYLFTISSVLWLVDMFAIPIYIQRRHDRTKARFQIIEMNTAFAADPALHAEFTAFASKHYVTESLQFLEDVKTYQRYFFEKADTWKVTKFKSLVESYVQYGSRMEVNISHDMRDKIIELYRGPPDRHREFYNAFDAAAHEVERMIHDGVWTEFLIKRSKKSGAMANGAIIPAFSAGTDKSPRQQED